MYKETRDSTEDMPDILLAELIALFSEWMFAFKVTDACAKAVYVLLETLMPSDTNIGSWPQLKSALESVTKNSCEEIDICPNDCIAFISCKHPKLAYYKHAHRTWCPYCGSDRYLQVDGVQRSAKRNFTSHCATTSKDFSTRTSSLHTCLGQQGNASRAMSNNHTASTKRYKITIMRNVCVTYCIYELHNGQQCTHMHRLLKNVNVNINVNVGHVRIR